MNKEFLTQQLGEKIKKMSKDAFVNYIRALCKIYNKSHNDKLDNYIYIKEGNYYDN